MPPSRFDPPPAYADLTPSQVLDALDAVGWRGDGRILQLNSYENRVFMVHLEDSGAVVAKFYRPRRWSDAQILEEHAFALELAEAEVPVMPPLLLHAGAGRGTVRLSPEVQPTLATLDAAHGAHRLAVAACSAGRAPELDDPATLQWLGRFIGRLHSVGARSGFAVRRRIDALPEAQAARQLLLDGEFIDAQQQPAWLDACDRAIELTHRAFERTGATAQLRLHGDCHPGNVLWREDGPHVVDLDDACMGPAVQDLWMLVSGDSESMARQLRLLLRGYRQLRRFDERELALIEPLRTLRMLRHSAWIAERWADPAFPLAFPWFGSAAYWSQQAAQLREQAQLMAAR